jgi:hypothetical protein
MRHESHYISNARNQKAEPMGGIFIYEPVTRHIITILSDRDYSEFLTLKQMAAMEAAK